MGLPFMSIYAIWNEIKWGDEKKEESHAEREIFQVQNNFLILLVIAS